MAIVYCKSQRILTDEHKGRRPHQHDDGLYKVSPDDSRQASSDGEHSSHSQQQTDGRVRVPLQGLLDEDGAGVQVSLGGSKPDGN